MLNEAKRSEASPDGYQNVGKSLFCRLPGILHDCFHRAGALESLQRFALQAFQRSGKCRQELADRFVLQAFKRQNGTALVYRPRISYTLTVLKFELLHPHWDPHPPNAISSDTLSDRH